MNPSKQFLDFFEILNKQYHPDNNKKINNKRNNITKMF